MKKAQIVICECGSAFAACVEPYCYTERDWTKQLKEYVNKGYKVDLVNVEGFSLEECKCEKEIKTDKNQIELF